MPPPAALQLQDAVDLLAEAAGIPAGQAGGDARRCLEAALQQSGAATVFIDGVDEVSPAFEQKVLRIVKLLLDTHLHLLWIGCRPEVSGPLRRALGCVPCELRPLSLSEQKSYLRERWGASAGDDDAAAAAAADGPRHLDALCSDVVETIALAPVTESDSRSRRGRSLLDAPLHVQMLCEAYVADAMAQLQKGEWHLLRGSGFVLFDLYRRFEKQKRDRFITRHELEDVIENFSFSDNFDEIHQKCAMYLLITDGAFPDADATQFKEYVTGQKGLLMKEKTGILWTDDYGQPHFAHFTFIQYFSAVWLGQNASSSGTAKIIVRELFRHNEGLGRHFLEHMLAEDLSLHRAILSEDKEAVERELESGSGVHQIDRGGRLPLHLAATKGMAELAEKLVRGGCDLRKCDDLLGFTPLQYADISAVAEINWMKRRDHLAVADVLLQAGADSSHLSGTIADAMTDVNVTVDAAGRGLVHVTRLLLTEVTAAIEKTNIYETEQSKDTFPGNSDNTSKSITRALTIGSESGGLDAATERGYTDIVDVLPKRRCNPNDPVNHERSPLHGASQDKSERLVANRRRANVISLLLNHGADPNIADDQGMSPLDFAEQSGNEIAVGLLSRHSNESNAEPTQL